MQLLGGRIMSERTAKVSDGSCAVFLTTAELRALGVDPEGTDRIGYSVTDAGIVVSDIGGEE